MKYRKIRQKSDKQKVVERCDKFIREILIRERGFKCEICGRSPSNLGVSHILSKGVYPKLRYYRWNLLLMCWLPCHHTLHHATHDDPKYQKIYQRIVYLRGENYKDSLLLAEKAQPKYDLHYLHTVETALKYDLKTYENEKEQK